MASQCSLHVQQVPPTHWVLFRLGSVLGSTAARKFRTLKMTDSMFSKSSLCGQYPVFWVAEIERRSSNVVKAPMGFFVFGSSVSVLQKPRDTVECPVKRSEGSGEKFVDTTFDPNADENFVPRFQKMLRSWTDAMCCYVVEILHCVVDYISFWLFFRAIFCRLPTCDRPFDPDLDGWCTCPSLFLLPFAYFAYLCILSLVSLTLYTFAASMMGFRARVLDTKGVETTKPGSRTKRSDPPSEKYLRLMVIHATHVTLLLPGICDTSRWCMWTRRSQAMTAQPASQETVGCEQRRRGSQGVSH